MEAGIGHGVPLNSFHIADVFSKQDTYWQFHRRLRGLIIFGKGDSIKEKESDFLLRRYSFYLGTRCRICGERKGEFVERRKRKEREL